MRKKNLSVILIILITLLLIAIVIWFYDNRIKNVQKKMTPVVSFNFKNLNKNHHEKDAIDLTPRCIHNGM